MTNRIVVVLRFLVACVANLLADLAQAETLLPTIFGVVGAVAAVDGGSPLAVRITGFTTTILSAAIVATPKVVAVGNQIETDLEILLAKAEGKPASVAAAAVPTTAGTPPVTAADVPAAVSSTSTSQAGAAAGSAATAAAPAASSPAATPSVQAAVDALVSEWQAQASTGGPA